MFSNADHRSTKFALCRPVGPIRLHNPSAHRRSAWSPATAFAFASHKLGPLRTQQSSRLRTQQLSPWPTCWSPAALGFPTQTSAAPLWSAATAFCVGRCIEHRDSFRGAIIPSMPSGGWRGPQSTQRRFAKAACAASCTEAGRENSHPGRLSRGSLRRCLSTPQILGVPNGPGGIQGIPESPCLVQVCEPQGFILLRRQRTAR